MVDSSEEYALMEERKELMVSPIDDDDDEEVKPIFRVAHFLKPTLPSSQNPPFLPSRPKFQELMTKSCLSSLNVKFRGGVMYMNGWSKWVNELKPLYQQTWKKAGIFEAITASTFKIHLHSDLILALGEKWCLQTNTFILPWGESTVTLEDLLVLGGFSVLGHSVLKPVKTKECVEMEERLGEVFKVFGKSKVNLYHHGWMEYFEGKGGNDHLEHVAFLTLWLSRFVLPKNSFQNVDKGVIPIAFHLSQGIPIALAPAVLATVYRDLNLLKQFIVSSSKHTEHSSNSRCIVDESELILRAPLQFVQLWAWERFITLQPKPSVVYCGEPRVARWHKVKKLESVDPKSEMNSAGECFLWRPYAIDTVKNWDVKRFYKEREEYVVVGPNMGREILIFARLIRASELVGMDCVELYNPHRVCMQFGFDQDVPGCVNHAWRNYDRPIKDANLYIPSRLFESDVSTRYLEWWKDQNVALGDAFKCVTKGKRSKTHGRIPRLSWGHNEKLNASVCCEFVQKCDEVRTEGPHGQSSSALNDGTQTSPQRKALIESKPLKSEELDGDEAYEAKEMVTLERKENNDKLGGCKFNLPDSLELPSEGPNANRRDGRYAEFSRSGIAKMSLQIRNDSVEAHKVGTNVINRTEGNMQIENIEMIDIPKLEMRIRNLENIISGKVPVPGTR
ncbi:uncharacterized protein [Solanum tuberosum]|uniref:uncharacterized protein n=1 Tax=Solanum tuberosum TaxID=4113 RepID=UPI0003D257D1|nr:PREDICTED: uncharacterized protein LOC102583947 [Solanum tuberosum]